MNSSNLKKINILVLTDFETHGKGESIYSLVLEMSKNDRCGDVFIASRHRPENSTFFSNFSCPTVFGKYLNDEFEFDVHGTWYKECVSRKIEKFDVLFLRLDRPCTNNQLDLLKQAFDSKLIINDPVGIQVTGSKRFLLNFPELTPPCGLISSFDEAQEIAAGQNIVLKPIEGYGGIGLVFIGDNEYKIGDDIVDDKTLKRHVDCYLEKAGEMLWMKYLREVSQGDKRIIVVADDVLGATLRLPAKDSWLCNLKQGGSAAAAEVDPEELKIAHSLIPDMKKNGVVIFGFDTLVDDNGKRILSEINTLNVGGLIQAQEFSNNPVIEMAASGLWKFISNVV